MVPSLSAAEAARIVEERARAPFRGTEDFQRALPPAASAQIDGPIDIKSRFFSAEATAHVGRVTAGYRALIERGERGHSVIIALTQILP